MATITLNKTNIQWNTYLTNMSSFLKRNDVVGYICARNSRVIMNALTEYQTMIEKLISKYGTECLDEEGNPTGAVGIPISDKDAIKNFSAEIESYSKIQQQIDILTLSYDEIQGVLTGEEILLLDFMCIE